MNLEKIKSFFTQLFTEFGSEESIAVLFFLTISFLIGLLFGALSRNRKIRRLNKMIKERDNDLITLRAENGAFKEQLEISDERLQKALVDYESANTLLTQTEADRNRLQGELEEARFIASQTNTTDGADSQKVDELNELILDLQIQNDRLKAQLASSDNNSGGDSGSDINPVVNTNQGVNDDRIELLENKLEQLADENISLSTIKNRLEQLERENDRLQKDLSGLKEGSITTIEDSSENKQAKARTALKTAIGSRIKQAALSDKNNLKLIDGIGPFIENKLNDIGIYTFEQIAQLDEELIDHITNAIQFFPGRIQRDDWVGQAKKLMK